MGARVWQIALAEVQHGAAALPVTRNFVRLLAEDAGEGVQDWAAAVLIGRCRNDPCESVSRGPFLRHQSMRSLP